MRTLLLNNNFYPLDFISEIKAIKFVLNEKVEVISEWNKYIGSSSGKINIPAILRLKYIVKYPFLPIKFSKENLFKRDQFICQYCGKSFFQGALTVDHILPKKLGGKNGWLNCTTSCWNCNNKKGSKRLEDCGLRLLNKPMIPRSKVQLDYSVMKMAEKHESWIPYINI